MSHNSNNNADGKNVVFSPDYGQMMKNQTNGAIVEAFLAYLFNPNSQHSTKTLATLVRNFSLILVIKTLLEESKTYLDKFKFTDTNFLRYFYQRLRYSERRYDILKIADKWLYQKKVMSISNLTPFLESKRIYLSQPGTYYYQEKAYLIKVVVADNLLSFGAPNIASVHNYIETEVMHKNQEILYGGKTTMSRVTISPSDVIKIEPVLLSHAFETENYRRLKESIHNHFMVDAVLKFPSFPLCVNFDGPPGTGKTTFGNYIATSGIFDRVIIMNMVQSNQRTFEDMISFMERQIGNTSSKSKKQDDEPEIILLILDEMDKWLQSYTNARIHKLRDEARTKKMSGEGKDQQVLMEHSKLTQQEEREKRTQLRYEFLDQLYKLVDGHMLSDTRKYVIIFNTNHFDRLFINVDVRYQALYDRFQRYKFDLNSKPEVIQYLRAITEQIRHYPVDPDVPDHKKEMFGDTSTKLCTYDDSIFDLVPDDIRISYRTLLKVLRTNGFVIKDTVESLANTGNMTNYRDYDSQTNTEDSEDSDVFEDSEEEPEKESEKKSD